LGLSLFVLIGLAPLVAQARPKSIDANFIQEKEMKILARPLVSEGRLVFRAPDHLRWEYRSPIQSVMLMQNDAARKFTRQNGEWIEDKGVGLDAVPMILAQMTAWLEGRFVESDAALFTAVRNGQTVRLVPKEEGMRAVIASIELRLAGQGELIEAVDIRENADAVTRIRFKNIVSDQPIDDALFTAP
jgi:hypothetical protein